MPMSWFSFLLLLFGSSWAGVGLFRWYAIEKGMLDHPNARSSHIAPTPRGGGVIFFLGWFVLLGVFYYYNMISREGAWVFLSPFLIGLLGFWDDHKDISALTRFVLQCLGAGVGLFMLGEGGDLIQAWLPIFVPLPLCFLILVFGIVWMINLFNFMDGSDGIAASEAMFVFGVSGFMLLQVNANELATLAWGLTALLAGFLAWNWPTARIFMGDSGSTFLGAMIALYALISYISYDMPLMLWVILTGLFWFDATITLIRRILAGEDWRKPHRIHAYQRLIQSGWSHQQVLLGTIAVNGILSALALLAFYEPRLLTFAFSATLVLLSVLYILVEVAKPMFKTWHEV